MIGTLRRLRVRDGFARLRHDAVVGRDDEDDDVGGLGAARTHGGEGLVTGRVEEDDRALLGVDAVGADVLRDAAGLARRDARVRILSSKRRLAVVDVTHDGDDGSAVHVVAALVRDLAAGGGDHVGRADRDVLDLVAELARQDLRGVGVELGVDVHAGHAELDQLHQALRWP